MKIKKTIRREKSISNKQAATVPYHRKPEDLTLKEWQIALRKQFVTGKNFAIKKLDGHPVFSDYSVS